jgi:AAA15 family ATPase/GTPase
MGNLILNSLEVRRFRGFQHLQIDHLEQVNLIVGKNNIGKSSLLEALRLYARRGYPALIWEFLSERDEYNREVENSGSAIIEKLLASLKYLFYDRTDITIDSEPIQIGPINSPDDVMTLGVGWYTFRNDGEVSRRIRLTLEEFDSVESSEPRFVVQSGEKSTVSYPLPRERSSMRLQRSRTDLDEINCIFTKSDGLENRQINELWKNVSLTPLEKEVLSALRIVAPGVEALNIFNESLFESKIFVKVASIDERIPLRSLGNGMLRTLGIALALANAKEGFLLIDEIENGLHYSVQPDLWRLIFRLARRLNVQVFATTHSWDCIEAFQEVTEEDEQVKGMLISLENRKSGVEAVLYNEEELKIVTRERIEVR